ncbi:MAG TPA: MFS transporter [Amnibacterium sp.]|jgi:MFS family permease|uniref:MFS transporter n=1 Tax=Amnibacterium sp. TaxID=1872496 RepID=UPI002F943883
MDARRAELTYLAAAVPMRLVSGGAGVALALAAAIQLQNVALGGALIAVLTAPSVIAAPLIGALLDAARSPRHLMLGASVMLAGVLVLCAFLTVVPLPIVFAALIVGGIVMPVFMGGLSAFVGEVLPGDVARGTAVDALAYNIAGIGGPGLVALATVVLSPTGALLALAVVALVGGVVLQLLPLVPRGGSMHPAALLRGIGGATRHLLTHHPLTRSTTAGTIVQLGGGAMPVVAVLLAVQRGGGESGGGWLLTGFAIGGVAGALAITTPAVTRLLGRLPARRVMAIGFTATGLLTLLAAVVPTFALTLVALTLAGLPDAPGVAAMLRIRQEESPSEVRAQVFIVGAGLRSAAASIGAALVGLVTHVDPALLLGAIAVPWLLSWPILLAGTRPRTAATADGLPVAR